MLILFITLYYIILKRIGPLLMDVILLDDDMEVIDILIQWTVVVFFILMFYDCMTYLINFSL